MFYDNTLSRSILDYTYHRFLFHNTSASLSILVVRYFHRGKYHFILIKLLGFSFHLRPYSIESLLLSPIFYKSMQKMWAEEKKDCSYKLHKSEDHITLTTLSKRRVILRLFFCPNSLLSFLEIKTAESIFICLIVKAIFYVL